MFGKKRLFAQMDGFVDIILIGIGEATLQQQKRQGQREDRHAAARVANLLVGRDSLPPPNAEQEKLSAKHLAATMLKEHHDIRFAAVMCLRTTGITHPDECAITVMQTIDWISTLGEIPANPPDPDQMRNWPMILE